MSEEKCHEQLKIAERTIAKLKSEIQAIRAKTLREVADWLVSDECSWTNDTPRSIWNAIDEMAVSALKRSEQIK